MDLFYNSVKQRKDAGLLEQPATAKELVAEAERLEIKAKAPLVLAELLFTDKILMEVSQWDSCQVIRLCLAYWLH